MEHEQQPKNLTTVEAIVSACKTLDQQIIQNPFDGMVSQAHRCILSQGGAFADEKTVTKLFIENTFLTRIKKFKSELNEYLIGRFM